MCRLEIELYQYGELVYGKVAHMDESSRRRGFILENESIAVLSVNRPSLRPNTLWLRGSCKSYDNSPFATICETKQDAEKLIQSIKRAVDDINALEVFRGTKTKE